MGGQIGGFHRHAGFGAKPSRDTQHLALTLKIQAVAGFYFHTGDAIVQQGLQARQAFREQGIFRCVAGQAHAGQNAAAGLGDIGIAGAAQALFGFFGTVASEYQMGVAVDQGRCQPAALAVDDCIDVLQVGCRSCAVVPDINDMAITPDDDAVFDDAIIRTVERGQMDMLDGAVRIVMAFHLTTPSAA